MVLLRGCGDKMESARMEGQGYGPRSPQGLGVCQLPVPHSERERDLAEAYLPAVFCQEERVIPSGKGPCYSEAPTVRASTSVSHGALPGEGLNT